MPSRCYKFKMVYQLAKLVAVGILLLLTSTNAGAQKQGGKLIDSLLQELPKAKEDTNKVILLNVLGKLYAASDPDWGIKFANQAQALAEKLNWDKGIAAAYNVMGICVFYRSDYNSSLLYWKKALKIFEQIQDKNGILKVIGNIGSIYEVQGDYSNALENSLLALKYAEELNDKNSININLGNIGSNYEYLGNYKKALEYETKSLVLSRAIPDTPGIAMAMGNIGNIYCSEKKYTEALTYQNGALQYDDYLGNKEGVARDLDNIGSIYTATKEYDKAFENFFKVLELSRQNKLKVTEAKALSYIADAILMIVNDSSQAYKGVNNAALIAKYFKIPATRKELLKTAIDCYKKSIAIDTVLANTNELQVNYYSLSIAQKMIGDYAAALASTDKYIELKDSVFSLASKVKIANLETKRELELKDKQIIIDKLEVAKKRNERVFFIAGIIVLLVVITIVIRNMRLAAAKELSENKLNAFQARMNPHFIFNSLSSIQSLVMNNENEASIDYLSEFSTLMRQILDNSAKSKVLLETEIEMLRSYIQLEHLRFDCFEWHIHIAEDVAESQAEVPGMIVQPFVENAILHGLIPRAGGGQLNITFERAGKQIICTVDDNGIGRQRSAELNAGRNKSRQSHGISIAVNRLTLLNDKKRGLVNRVVYTDKVENGIAAGTTVVIQIPVL